MDDAEALKWYCNTADRSQPSLIWATISSNIQLLNVKSGKRIEISAAAQGCRSGRGSCDLPQWRV
jgi:hypothetical protein